MSTEKIEPVFSARVWSSVLESIAAKRKAKMLPSADRMLGDIATLNASLPDSDPRKITLEWIRVLRDSSGPMAMPMTDGATWTTTEQSRVAVETHRALLSLIADALESYLPPAQS